MLTKSQDKGLEGSILNDEVSCFYDTQLTLSELVAGLHVAVTGLLYRAI